MLPVVGIIASGATTVAGSMGSAMETVASDALGAVTGMIPVAAPVLGAILVVGIAIKAFKKISGTR